MKRIKWISKGSLTGKLLQLMKLHDSTQESVSLQEENVGSGFFRNDYYDYHMQIRNALLEAERKKALGLGAWEKHRCGQ